MEDIMKKIILASALAFAFLVENVDASEDVLVNDCVNTETYPEGNTLENDLKKEKEYLHQVDQSKDCLIIFYLLRKKNIWTEKCFPNIFLIKKRITV